MFFRDSNPDGGTFGLRVNSGLATEDGQSSATVSREPDKHCCKFAFRLLVLFLQVFVVTNLLRSPSWCCPKCNQFSFFLFLVLLPGLKEHQAPSGLQGVLNVASAAEDISHI